MRAINFEKNKSKKPWAGPWRVRKLIKGSKKRNAFRASQVTEIWGAHMGQSLQQLYHQYPMERISKSIFKIFLGKPKYSCGLNLFFLGHMHFIESDTRDQESIPGQRSRTKKAPETCLPTDCHPSSQLTFHLNPVTSGIDIRGVWKNWAFHTGTHHLNFFPICSGLSPLGMITELHPKTIPPQGRAQILEKNCNVLLILRTRGL